MYSPLMMMACGSSPHARGLLDGMLPVNVVGGIIPACAGFTAMTLLGIMNVKDHPRMRGVYAAPAVRPQGGVGSSPHARGLRPKAAPMTY